MFEENGMNAIDFLYLLAGWCFLSTIWYSYKEDDDIAKVYMVLTVLIVLLPFIIAGIG